MAFSKLRTWTKTSRYRMKSVAIVARISANPHRTQAHILTDHPSAVTATSQE